MTESSIRTFAPATNRAIVLDGTTVVFTCSHEVWSEFKVADRRHCLVVVERDVLAEVIQRNGCVIIDSDIDLIRE